MAAALEHDEMCMDIFVYIMRTAGSSNRETCVRVILPFKASLLRASLQVVNKLVSLDDATS